MSRIEERARAIYNSWFDSASGWRIECQPEAVQVKLRRKYKEAGKLARLVIAARDVATTISIEEAEEEHAREFKQRTQGPNGDYYVYRCVAGCFLPALNGWRKERVRYFGLTDAYTNLASWVKAGIRRSKNDDSQFIARHQACFHACMVVHNVHEAIFALVIEKDPAEARAQALEELAQVTYHAALRDGKTADIEAIREELGRRFKF